MSGQVDVMPDHEVVEECKRMFTMYINGGLTAKQFADSCGARLIGRLGSILKDEGTGSEPCGWEVPGCGCETCLRANPSDWRGRVMILCPTCGNKRCPKATLHSNACTGSNAPGQKGSRWENQKPSAPSPSPPEDVSSEMNPFEAALRSRHNGYDADARASLPDRYQEPESPEKALDELIEESHALGLIEGRMECDDLRKDLEALLENHRVHPQNPIAPAPPLTVDEVLTQAAYGLRCAKSAMTNQRYEKPRIGMEDDFANVEKSMALIERYVAQVNAAAGKAVG